MSPAPKMAPSPDQLNLRGRRRAATSLTLGYLFFALIFATGCSGQPAQPIALPTPEETWETFRSAWKNEDLNLLLTTCAPIQKAQERCRKRFLGAQKKGHAREVGDLLGPLVIKDDLGSLRFYEFEPRDRPDETEEVVFELFPNLGWKISDF